MFQRRLRRHQKSQKSGKSLRIFKSYWQKRQWKTTWENKIPIFKGYKVHVFFLLRCLESTSHVINGTSIKHIRLQLTTHARTIQKNNDTQNFLVSPSLVGGWTNPSEKYYCSQIGWSPQVGVKIKTCLKPPPSSGFMFSVSATEKTKKTVAPILHGGTIRDPQLDSQLHGVMPINIAKSKKKLQTIPMLQHAATIWNHFPQNINKQKTWVCCLFPGQFFVFGGMS